MNTICLHHYDHDGYMSAGIIKRVYPDCEFFEMNYGRKIPWDAINKCELIIIVDFSLPIDKMEYINSKRKLIWIDHHISIINEANERGFNPSGKRLIGKSGCRLTWEYFFPKEPIPLIIDALADYDVFNFDYNNDVRFNDALIYEHGLRSYDVKLDNEQLWNSIFSNDKVFASQVYNDGVAIWRYQQKQDKNIKYTVFKGTFENYRCMIVNNNTCGSLSFATVWNKDKFDIMMTFGIVNDSISCSLYTTKDNINVAKLCRKYGGGGHGKASGFSVKLKNNDVFESIGISNVTAFED